MNIDKHNDKLAGVYSFKQAFSVLDGRLSTSMDDVYSILNHYTGMSLFTHQLPVAMDYLKEDKPKWYVEGVRKLEKIKEVVGNDFNDLMEYLDLEHSADQIQVEQVGEDKRNVIGKYLADNSLLVKHFGEEEKP